MLEKLQLPLESYKYITKILGSHFLIKSTLGNGNQNSENPGKNQIQYSDYTLVTQDLHTFLYSEKNNQSV